MKVFTVNPFIRPFSAVSLIIDLELIALEKGENARIRPLFGQNCRLGEGLIPAYHCISDKSYTVVSPNKATPNKAKNALFVRKFEDKWAKNGAKIALFDPISKKRLVALSGVTTISKSKK